MSPSEKAEDGSSYTVDVNPDVAFTILYEDARGRLLFSIEVGKDPATIFLSPIPSEGGLMVEAGDDATKRRVALALERVQAYFRAKGLTVELD